MQQYQRAMYKRKKSESITRTVNNFILARSLLPPAPKAEQCQWLLDHVLPPALMVDKQTTPCTVSSCTEEQDMVDDARRASGNPTVRVSDASPSSSPAVLSSSLDVRLHRAKGVPDSHAAPSPLMSESAWLGERGFPGVHRVESAFAAAASHSEMGAMLQYFARSVADLFARGLHSGVRVAEEYERRLQESLSKGSDSALQPYLYELQGFSTLFSFLWSQLVVVDAKLRLCTSTAACVPCATGTSSLSCDATPCETKHVVDEIARSVSSSQLRKPPSDSISALAHRGCVSKATQTTDARCGTGGGASSSYYRAQEMTSTTTSRKEGKCNTHDDGICENHPRRRTWRVLDEGDYDARVGAGACTGSNMKDIHNTSSYTSVLVDSTDNKDCPYNIIRASGDTSKRYTTAMDLAAPHGCAWAASSSTSILPDRVAGVHSRDDVAHTSPTNGLMGCGDMCNKQAHFALRASSYHAPTRQQPGQRHMQPAQPAPPRQPHHPQHRPVESVKDDTTPSSDNLLPALVINHHAPMPEPLASCRRNNEPPSSLTMPSSSSHYQTPKPKRSSRTSLVQQQQHHCYSESRSLSPPPPHEDRDVLIDRMIHLEQVERLRRQLGAKQIRDFASERDKTDYMKQLAELAQQF